MLLKNMFSTLLLVLTLASCSSENSNTDDVRSTNNNQVEIDNTPKVLESPEIHFQVTGYNSGKANLVGLYTDQQYLLDTATIQNGGKITFKKGDPYQPGMAFLLLPDQSFFQLLISEDQTFTMKAIKGDYVGSMQVEGSIDNQLLYENLKFEAEWQPKVNVVNNKFKTLQVNSSS